MNFKGMCVAADSEDHVSIYSKEEAFTIGELADWDNCTWGGSIFDCSWLDKKDQNGYWWTHNPMEACSPEHGMYATCEDLFDGTPIWQACAATCSKFQYVYRPRRALLQGPASLISEPSSGPVAKE